MKRLDDAELDREFKILKPALLIEACNLLHSLDISSQNQDVQGEALTG